MGSLLPLGGAPGSPQEHVCLSVRSPCACLSFFSKEGVTVEASSDPMRVWPSAGSLLPLRKSLEPSAGSLLPLGESLEPDLLPLCESLDP